MSRATRCIRSLSLAILLSFGVLASATGRSEAAGWLEKNFWLSGPNYDNALPPCQAGLDKIASGFAEKESRFWNSSLQIVGFERVREIGYHPWAAGTIPRRFCQAVALVSPGPDVRPRPHMVYYWIGEDTGIIGASWGVRWCVTGVDRNWAYNPYCKMARP